MLLLPVTEGKELIPIAVFSLPFAPFPELGPYKLFVAGKLNPETVVQLATPAVVATKA